MFHIVKLRGGCAKRTKAIITMGKYRR